MRARHQHRRLKWTPSAGGTGREAGSRLDYPATAAAYPIQDRDGYPPRIPSIGRRDRAYCSERGFLITNIPTLYPAGNGRRTSLNMGEIRYLMFGTMLGY